mmetsp:Transcript_7785/g.11909  ORF Transcript_7785/g.11909 Transcript_7785/m.11909 type:complete len:105 (-) Transcript_7785:187-501(-)
MPFWKILRNTMHWIKKKSIIERWDTRIHEKDVSLKQKKKDAVMKSGRKLKQWNSRGNSKLLESWDFLLQFSCICEKCTRQIQKTLILGSCRIFAKAAINYGINA